MTSEFSAVCPCGVTVEWPDTAKQMKCPMCNRVLVVAAWPNEPMVVVQK